MITCADSGGPAELVKDGETGFVSEPSVDAVAAVLSRVAGEPRLAERLGSAALPVAERHSWPDAIEKLLAR